MKIRLAYFLGYTFQLLAFISPTSCQVKEPQPDNRITLNYLALGDSYTIGESVSITESYPFQLAKAISNEEITLSAPKIIAKTGWRTDDLINAINKEDPEPNYDLVSLLIGVNNQYQSKPIIQYRKEFQELLERAIVLANGNNSRVFVLSIPNYGYTPFGKEKQEKISKEISEYNATNKEIAEAYGVAWFNITLISEKGLSEPNLVANDGLHPSAEMYAAWVEEIKNEVYNLLFTK